jgi:2-polyprenyl-3-methyl-5-hydroxy-6-metoxy-1,4-benzoquinol methylase
MLCWPTETADNRKREFTMVMICMFCGKGIEKILYGGIMHQDAEYAVAYCDHCHIGATVPQPSDEELARSYSANDYRLETGRRFNRLVEYCIYLFRVQKKRRIEKHTARGRILDIGCGRGLFLHLMKQDGWSVQGIEIDRAIAARLSEAYGIDVLSGDLLQRRLPEASYDVVVISHVLEHLRRPLDTIHECKRLLKQGGLLIISVPNIHSLQALAGQKVWFHLDLPNHLHHYSEQGLVDLLHNNAFRIAHTRRLDLEYGPFGWLQTLLNLSGIRKNTLYHLLKSSSLRKNDREKPENKDLLKTLLFLPFYVPASLLLSIFEILIKRAGTFEVFAVKE